MRPADRASCSDPSLICQFPTRAGRSFKAKSGVAARCETAPKRWSCHTRNPARRSEQGNGDERPKCESARRHASTDWRGQGRSAPPSPLAFSGAGGPGRRSRTTNECVRFAAFDRDLAMGVVALVCECSKTLTSHHRKGESCEAIALNVPGRRRIARLTGLIGAGAAQNDADRLVKDRHVTP